MKTQELARGAMCVAIYGILLLINQQTGLFVESSLSWLFVFPVLVYTALYGAYPGAVTGLAMGLLTFLFGSFTTWFYSWSSLIMGYVYGMQIKKQRPAMTRFFTLFVLCILANTCIMAIWAGLFGIDYAEDMAMLQNIAPWLSLSAYMAILILLMSFLQAICIHLLAYVLCSRLKIHTLALPSLKDMQPKRWIGTVSLLLWLMILLLFASGMVKYSKGSENLAIVILFTDIVVLEYYGALFFFRMAVQKQKRWLAVIAVLGAFVPGVNLVWMLIGLADCLSRGKLLHGNRGAL